MRDERPEDLAELDYEVMFDRKIPYIPYEELNNEEN